eukprot:5263648-Amphidinium_carterae.1
MQSMRVQGRRHQQMQSMRVQGMRHQQMHSMRVQGVQQQMHSMRVQGVQQQMHSMRVSRRVLIVPEFFRAQSSHTTMCQSTPSADNVPLSV